jgi:hypothetical protein
MEPQWYRRVAPGERGTVFDLGRMGIPGNSPRMKAIS